MVLAGAAALALLAAVLTGNPWIAGLVIALAAAGIVLLVRDWRGAANNAAAAGSEEPPFTEFDRPPRADPTPEELSPDISTEPGGPSSDARAD